MMGVIGKYLELMIDEKLGLRDIATTYGTLLSSYVIVGICDHSVQFSINLPVT